MSTTTTTEAARICGELVTLLTCAREDFGVRYGAGTPSCDDAPAWMLSDRAMRAGFAA